MENRLEKALEFANYRRTLNQQADQLKLRTEKLLTYAINGGIFTITTNLISFVNLLSQRGIEEVVLLDDNNIPIEIANLEEFLDNILNRYFSVVNDYHAEYQKIKKARSVSKILDIE